MSIFYLTLDKKILDFMLFRKFKDVCFVIWEIDRKSLDNNEVENLTNFVEVRLFKIFSKTT